MHYFYYMGLTLFSLTAIFRGDPAIVDYVMGVVCGYSIQNKTINKIALLMGVLRWIFLIKKSLFDFEVKSVIIFLMGMCWGCDIWNDENKLRNNAHIVEIVRTRPNIVHAIPVTV